MNAEFLVNELNAAVERGDECVMSDIAVWLVLAVLCIVPYITVDNGDDDDD